MEVGNETHHSGAVEQIGKSPPGLLIRAGGGQQGSFNKFLQRASVLSLVALLIPSPIPAQEEVPTLPPICVYDYDNGVRICFGNDAIYLGSGTGAVDGRGWLCETVLLLPATGQTGFGLPFPAIDVFHSGYSYVSSPTPNGTLGPYWFYGLERMCVVLSSGEKRLPGLSDANTAWRGTPVEAILQPVSGDIPDQVKRVRELTVYDANGSAMRFLAYIASEVNDVSPLRERWVIIPSKGVKASLEVETDESTGRIRRLILRGGPPGRIREGGSWVYQFAPPRHGVGWGGAIKARLHDFVTAIPPDYTQIQIEPAITSPNGNRWSVQVGNYARDGRWHPASDGTSGVWLILRDLQTQRGLRWNRLTGDVYYFTLENERQAVHIGKVPPEGAARSWELIWHNRAPNTTQDRIVAQLQSSGGRGGYDTYHIAAANSSTDARTQVQSWLYWTDIPTREKDMYSHAYGREPENLRGRLSGEALGSLSQRYPVMSYGYQYLDGRAFLTQITRPRPGEDFRAQLLHTWTGDRMFSEMTLVRRSYIYNNPDRAWERVVLRFNGQGQAGEGQIQSIEVYDHIVAIRPLISRFFRLCLAGAKAFCTAASTRSRLPST
jgi:hypothetical protein